MSIDSADGLELQFLGRPRVLRDGRDVTPEIGAKGSGLLAYLALNAPNPVSREGLAASLWSDKADDAARYRLRHTLWDLRRSLGDELIRSDQVNCWLDLKGEVSIDLVRFQQGCRAVGVSASGHPATPEHLPTLRQVVEQYRGELLEGLIVREAPLFEEWLLVERERLQLLFQEALWSLARLQQIEMDYAGAILTLNRLIESDPLQERAYRALMGVYLAQGDRSAALRVYRQCSLKLVAELGVKPSPDTERLRELIAQNTSPSADEAIKRANALFQEGRYDDALSGLTVAEALAPDAVTQSHIALLRAEIAHTQGQHSQVLSFIQVARQALRDLAGGRAH